MLGRTDGITNEVLEPITFVLAYRTVLVLYVQLLVLRVCDTKVHLFHLQRTDLFKSKQFTVIKRCFSVAFLLKIC